MPLAPPTVVTSTATSITKTTATLRGTFNPNVTSGTSIGGTYRFNYGLTTGYGSTTSAVAITGVTGVLRSTGITGLACGTTYNFRGSVTNGGATVNGGNQPFGTSACTAPVITQGASVGVIMSEDGSPTPFSLILNATDDDAGTLTWSISSGASNGAAGASGTGTSKAISYNPALDYTGPDSFVVQVRNTTTNLSDFITVNVTVNPVNDPPVITEGAGPLAQVIDEDSFPTAFSLTLNATDLDTAAGSLVWSISGVAGNGTASASGTGLSKAIGYTPNPDYNGSDSFTVRVFDGASFDSITISVNISPRNDAPLITPVGPQSGTEGSLVTITPIVVDPDDTNNGSNISWSFVMGQQLGMNISSTGVITWTPPLGPPAVFNQMYPITIRAADGLEHGSIPDDDAFTLTINPPDTDFDTLADYDDLCINFADSTNADFDGDGAATPGTNGADANSGGDVCDLDDDNDTIPDSYELMNSMNPFDASDAAADNDNDGVTNLQEFLDGTNPNLVNLIINATGYLTPYILVPPSPASIHSAATAVSANDYGPYRPGDNTITWTASNSASSDLAVSDPVNLVSNPPTQPFYIRPLLNLAADQQAVEGMAVTVNVTLNGNPVVYPVTVNYTVSGTASNPLDHDAAAGVVTIASGLVGNIPFNIASDALSESNETVVFTIGSASNAAPGAKTTHVVTIVEGNVAPGGALEFDQGGGLLLTNAHAGANGGVVNILANATDLNPGETATLSYDWSGTDNALLPPVNVSNWMTAATSAGNYLVDVVITDTGTPAMSTRLTRILNVQTGAAVALTGADTDGDGIADNVEGASDSDGDGVPNYLDALEASSDSIYLPDQTVDIANSFLIQTEPGLRIGTGGTAQAASNFAGDKFGALLTNSDITNFGDANGNPPVTPNDNFQHVGGIYSFVVSGLMPGSSARVVIPLRSAIPRNARYRKFNPATGWGSFVGNGSNRVASARGALGACPEAGSSQYVAGLAYLDNCVELLISDGGPNDSDNSVNGEISDPGAVGVSLNAPTLATVEEGGGRMSLPLLILLILIGGTGAYFRLRGVRLN